MGDQAMVQLAGEQRDAVHSDVMAKPVTGHTDHAAAGLEQHLIEAGPILDRGFKPRRQGRWPGEKGTHDSLPLRTHVLARVSLSRPV